MFQIGDSVSVELPAGTFVGTVREVLPNYASMGRTYYRVMGDQPEPFETLTSSPQTICHQDSKSGDGLSSHNH